MIPSKRNPIVEGDCIATMAKMKPRSVSLVIGSPPYHGKMKRYGRATQRKYLDD